MYPSPTLLCDVCSSAYGERIGPGDAKGAEVPVGMGVLTLGRQGASMAICDLKYCEVLAHDEEVTDMTHEAGTFGLAALSQVSAKNGIYDPGQWSFTANVIKIGYNTRGLIQRAKGSEGIMGVDGLFGTPRDLRYNL